MVPATFPAFRQQGLKLCLAAWLLGELGIDTRASSGITLQGTSVRGYVTPEMDGESARDPECYLANHDPHTVF